MGTWAPHFGHNAATSFATAASLPQIFTARLTGQPLRDIEPGSSFSCRASIQPPSGSDNFGISSFGPGLEGSIELTAGNARASSIEQTVLERARAAARNAGVGVDRGLDNGVAGSTDDDGTPSVREMTTPRSSRDHRSDGPQPATAPAARPPQRRDPASGATRSNGTDANNEPAGATAQADRSALPGPPAPPEPRGPPESTCLRAREWLSRSKIAVEAPGWRGATKAHTAGM